MKTSDKGIDLIKGHESLQLRAYLDPVGIPTIGYGHTKGVKMGQTITKEQAIQFLKQDLSDAEYAVNKLKLDFNQNQFDALVSFVFNLGEPKFRKSTLCKKLIANVNDPSIAFEFCRWKYGNVDGKIVVLPGLVKRRKDEAYLYFSKT